MKYDFSTSIIDTADDFYEAYKRCVEGKNGHENEDGIWQDSVVNIPAIVNGAFACELYIKSLLPEEEHRKMRHHIKVGYSKLSLNHQENIKTNVLKNPIVEQLGGFDICLSALATCFERWRYIFEYKDFGNVGLNGTLLLLPSFIEAFRIAALSKK